MLAAAIMAVQVPSAFETGANGFAFGFLLSQMAVILLYLRTLFERATPKNLITFYVVGLLMAGACWVLSLFFSSPHKFWFWAAGMLIYSAIPWVGRKLLSKFPLHPVYIPQRIGSFSIMIIGQIIASVVFGLESANWQMGSVHQSHGIYSSHYYLGAIFSFYPNSRL
jgi:low temperature requirement protein LtrA